MPGQHGRQGDITFAVRQAERWDKMIEEDKLRTLIKSYLPQAETDTIDNIANNIIRDVEAVIYSMVRQAVNQERENLYRKNAKS